MDFIRDFFFYALEDFVRFLFGVKILPDISLGYFLVACGILSVVIGALVTQLRGASLTPEAHMGNTRDRLLKARGARHM